MLYFYFDQDGTIAAAIAQEIGHLKTRIKPKYLFVLYSNVFDIKPGQTDTYLEDIYFITKENFYKKIGQHTELAHEIIINLFY